MIDIDAARNEIKRVETVLRTRYNYAHPVFNYLAAALEALEGDLPEATPAGAPPEETEEQLIAEAEAAVVVEEEVEEAAVESPREAEETNAEPKSPTRRARRRG